jgi:hypothetical protein
MPILMSLNPTLDDGLLCFEKTRLLLQYFTDVFRKSPIHPSARNSTQINGQTSLKFGMLSHDKFIIFEVSIAVKIHTVVF